MRRAARGLCQRADDAAAREINLEAVMCEALGVAQQHVGRASECRDIGGLPAEDSLRPWIAPRLVRDASERKAPLLDGLAVELEPRRDGDEGECVGESVADLQIGVMRGEASRRQLERSDDLVGV